MKDLNKIRLDINEIDKEMIKLFEKRMDLVKEVLNYKLENNLPILDSNRENEVIELNLKHLNNNEYKEYYISLIKNIMDISKEYQKYLLKKED